MIIVLFDHDFNKPLKFDTSEMEVVVENVKRFIDTPFIYTSATIYKSKKGRYLLMHKFFGVYDYKLLSEEAVKNLLINNDIDTYEKIFGEIEEG